MQIMANRRFFVVFDLDLRKNMVIIDDTGEVNRKSLAREGMKLVEILFDGDMAYDIARRLNHAIRVKKVEYNRKKKNTKNYSFYKILPSRELEFLGSVDSSNRVLAASSLEKVRDAIYFGHNVIYVVDILSKTIKKSSLEGLELGKRFNNFYKKK